MWALLVSTISPRRSSVPMLIISAFMDGYACVRFKQPVRDSSAILFLSVAARQWLRVY
jgi:hypothetical protein